MRRLPALLATVAAAAVAAGLVLLPGPAGAVEHYLQVSRHQQVRGIVTFVKNHNRPDHSRLEWRLQRWRDGRWTTTDQASWRSGSGMLGRRGRNPCVHNVGWLPNGGYRLRQYVDYHGSVIKGRAFRLDDKRCGNGTMRHDLFIHTEQGAHDRQCKDRRGDQPCRWETPKIDDYKSFGCIKLSPGDLADLVRHFHKAFRPGIRYRKAVVRLVVR